MRIAGNGGGSATPRYGARRRRNGQKCPRCKRFGTFAAVDGIDVEVRAGEAFGFLGPNGAGKSSTMRMVAPSTTCPTVPGFLSASAESCQTTMPVSVAP